MALLDDVSKYLETISDLSQSMENPHAEKQAILLERIIKNVEKCNELIIELNKCVGQISQANEDVNQTAELATRYRKNVQYNLGAISLLGPT